MNTILALSVVATAEVLCALTGNYGRKMRIRNWSIRVLGTIR